MKPLSFKHHCFSEDVVRHAVWLYFPFNLSLRDVGEMLTTHAAIDNTFNA